MLREGTYMEQWEEMESFKQWKRDDEVEWCNVVKLVM